MHQERRLSISPTTSSPVEQERRTSTALSNRPRGLSETRLLSTMHTHRSSSAQSAARWSLSCSVASKFDAAFYLRTFCSWASWNLIFDGSYFMTFNCDKACDKVWSTLLQCGFSVQLASHVGSHVGLTPSHTEEAMCGQSGEKGTGLVDNIAPTHELTCHHHFELTREEEIHIDLQ